MKVPYLLSLLTVTTLTWAAAQEWKVVAESMKCKDKLQVLGKEGERFVYVIDGTDKIKLIADDASAFTEQNSRQVTFSNKGQSESGRVYTFTQPGVMDGNPGKLEVVMNGELSKCKMALK
jgi:hypothetical protein